MKNRKNIFSIDEDAESFGQRLGVSQKQSSELIGYSQKFAGGQIGNSEYLGNIGQILSPNLKSNPNIVHDFFSAQFASNSITKQLSPSTYQGNIEKEDQLFKTVSTNQESVDDLATKSKAIQDKINGIELSSNVGGAAESVGSSLPHFANGLFGSLLKEKSDIAAGVGGAELEIIHS